MKHNDKVFGFQETVGIYLYANSIEEHKEKLFLIEKRISACGIKGIHKIFTDSPRKSKFSELLNLLESVQAGAITSVVCFDLVDLKGLFSSLDNVLKWGLIVSTADIRFATVVESLDQKTGEASWAWAMMSEFRKLEALSRSKRAIAGADGAVSRGQIIGRPSKIDTRKVRELRRLGHTLAEISDAMGISIGSAHKALKNNNLDISPKIFLSKKTGVFS